MDLILQYPVFTLDGRLLLPAETKLTAATMDRLADEGRANAFPTESIMNHATVRADIHRFLTLPPYHIIFADPGQTGHVLDLFERVTLPVPLLKIIDYFKEHDFHTYRHSLMVYALATLLAKVVGAADEEVAQESIAGPTHDFGKINVPLAILMKETPLSPDENRLLKHHVMAGYVLLCYYLHERESATIRLALNHHERKNGSGYPRGLKQQSRLVEIITVADIYDALISARPYRQGAYPNRTALEELTGMAERGEIGWKVLRTLISLNRAQKPDPDGLIVSTERRGEPPVGNMFGVLTD